MQDANLLIVPLCGCHDVRNAVTRIGIWEKVAPSVRLFGVIDRDYRDDEFIESQKNTLHVLEYHEVESFLCHPTVVQALAEAIGTGETITSEASIVEQIAEYCSTIMMDVVLQRTIFRARINLNVSIDRSHNLRNINEKTLREYIRNAASEEQRKAEDVIGPDATEKIFLYELGRFRDAISNRDVDEMLKLAPGKSLLKKLARLGRCSDELSFARGVFKHLKPDQFPFLDELQKTLLDGLRNPVTSE
jgi:hypothetical protein